MKLKLTDSVEEQKEATFFFNDSISLDVSAYKASCVIFQNQKEGFNREYIRVIIQPFVFYKTDNTIINQQAVLEFSYYEL